MIPTPSKGNMERLMVFAKYGAGNGQITVVRLYWVRYEMFELKCDIVYCSNADPFEVRQTST